MPDLKSLDKNCHTRHAIEDKCYGERANDHLQNSHHVSHLFYCRHCALPLTTHYPTVAYLTLPYINLDWNGWIWDKQRWIIEGDINGQYIIRVKNRKKRTNCVLVSRKKLDLFPVFHLSKSKQCQRANQAHRSDQSGKIFVWWSTQDTIHSCPQILNYS